MIGEIRDEPNLTTAEIANPATPRSQFQKTGSNATTDVIDSSVLTRSTGSPGRISRGLSNARGAAKKEVYGVTNLYFRDSRMISSIDA